MQNLNVISKLIDETITEVTNGKNESALYALKVIRMLLDQNERTIVKPKPFKTI